MALVPLSYNTRSLLARRSATVLTVVSIGATVTVMAGVLALQQGFATLFEKSGRDDVAVFLRPGATSESDSVFPWDRADVLIKTLPDIETDESEQPLASRELFLAVRLFKVDGGETNVPIRGVEASSFAIHGDNLAIAEGRRFEPGTDEVIVGKKLTERIQSCQLGDVLQLNTTPFRVVGVFEHDGPHASEIWGDTKRLMEALERPMLNRVLARLRPEADVEELSERLAEHKEVPAKVLTERQYLESQTVMLSVVLQGLGMFLAVVMGAAAVFTGTNTMLAAISSRTHEIGVLKSVGFRPLAIFASFLFESMVLGLVGGLLGCLFVLPLNGVQTGTTNWQTFTEVAFAFRVTPSLTATAVIFALVLGTLAGAWPAWRASRLLPTEALRRG